VSAQCANDVRRTLSQVHIQSCDFLWLAPGTYERLRFLFDIKSLLGESITRARTGTAIARGILHRYFGNAA